MTRDEEFYRRGANDNGIVGTLSENGFYYNLKDATKKIDKSHGVDYKKIDLDTIKENFGYFYPILKPIFDDNVLDDNNNIVNYGSDRDIPVLRLQLRYTYA
jgi:hypothetical protein